MTDSKTIDAAALNDTLEGFEDAGSRIRYPYLQADRATDDENNPGKGGTSYVLKIVEAHPGRDANEDDYIFSTVEVVSADGSVASAVGSMAQTSIKISGKYKAAGFSTLRDFVGSALGLQNTNTLTKGDVVSNIATGALAGKMVKCFAVDVGNKGPFTKTSFSPVGNN